MSNSRSDSANAIRVCPDLALAARQQGMEPVATLWCIARHLAGREHSWVDKEALRDFVVDHGLWSRSRFNELVRLGEPVFWVNVVGQRDGRPILYVKGKDKVSRSIGVEPGKTLTGRWTEVPLDELRGVAHRRGVCFEAVIGTPTGPKTFAKPQARFTLRKKTGVARRTQQRWNRAVKTRTVPAILQVTIAPRGYRPDQRFHEPGRFTFQPAADGPVEVLQRLGNIYLTRFPLHGRATARGERHPSIKDEGEKGGSPVRYVRTGTEYCRQIGKGREPRLFIGRGIQLAWRDGIKPVYFVA